MLTTFFLFKKEPYWLAHQQFFSEHWACPKWKHLFGPQLQNRNKCASLNFTFLLYIQGSGTLGKTIWDETQVLLQTSGGPQLGTLWEHGNLLGAWQEHIRNKVKSKNSPPPQRKKLDRSWVHSEPPHWLHEISLSKTVGHQFSPRLMMGAEFWGLGKKNLFDLKCIRNVNPAFMLDKALPNG